MKELIKQYLDHGISRRKLISGLTTIGMTTVAGRSWSAVISLTTAAKLAAAATTSHPPAMK